MLLHWLVSRWLPNQSHRRPQSNQAPQAKREIRRPSSNHKMSSQLVSDSFLGNYVLGDSTYQVPLMMETPGRETRSGFIDSYPDAQGAMEFRHLKNFGKSETLQRHGISGQQALFPKRTTKNAYFCQGLLQPRNSQKDDCEKRAWKLPGAAQRTRCQIRQYCQCAALWATRGYYGIVATPDRQLLTIREDQGNLGEVRRGFVSIT